MADESNEALRTPLGRERMLEDHQRRLDSVEDRMTSLERTKAASDKRWDYALRAIITIGSGIVIAVVSGLLASGAVHP